MDDPQAQRRAAARLASARHPCYDEEAHRHYARLHLAVAPGCNIQCNYCNRKFDCTNESRPGVTSALLTPAEAAERAVEVATRSGKLSVVGIAGPGDPLHESERVFDTIHRVRARLPDAILCLSTNGLLLPSLAERIVQAGVSHITVTINALDPAVGAKIYPWVRDGGAILRGEAGAKLLIDRQLTGVVAAVAAGAMVKINTVFIPGINAEEVIGIHTETLARGASIHNVVPLISEPHFGTAFAKAGIAGPKPAELDALRDSLPGAATVMRHCRQCRADAVGLLGESPTPAIATPAAAMESAKMAADSPMIPPAAGRAAARDAVDALRQREVRAIAAAAATLPALFAAAGGSRHPLTNGGNEILVAACCGADGHVSVHFGKCQEFQVIGLSAQGVRLVGLRRTPSYCHGGAGESDTLAAILATLDGVAVVVSAAIGRCPKAQLAAAGIATWVPRFPERAEIAAIAWLHATLAR